MGTSSSAILALPQTSTGHTMVPIMNSNAGSCYESTESISTNPLLWLVGSVSIRLLRSILAIFRSPKVPMQKPRIASQRKAAF